VKRLVLLALAVLIPTAAARADGCPPSQCGTATVAVPGSRTLAVRPGGARGPVLVYDLARGVSRFTLPGGVLSADGTRHFAAVALKRETFVARYDARTGAVRGRFTLDGRWWLNAVSADGRWLAFTKLVSGKRRHTSYRVVGAADGKVRHTLRLDGVSEAEAISRDGRRLFLVQYVRKGYVVRGYDLERRALVTLRAKGDPALMGGAAWGAVSSADGRWLLTLYLEPDGGVAVHALDLVNGTAACIDLPSASFEDARQYAFAVAPDGRTLVAGNPAAGVVAEVDLERSEVVSEVRFPARPYKPFGSTGAVSRDGRTAAFTAGGGVWRYDLARGRVDGPYAPGRRVIGVAFAGQALRAVRLDGKVVTLAR
jgi:hypothetical protein